MIIQKVESLVRAEVECYHEDKNIRYYTYSIGYETLNPYALIENEIEEHREIREVIEKEVNGYDYWHEVKITLSWYLELEKGVYTRIEKEI